MHRALGYTLLISLLGVVLCQSAVHILPPSQLVDDCCCTVSSVDATNNVEINPILNDIVKQRYFKYFKANIYSECPYWVVNQLCGLGGCSICECEDHEVPETFKHEDSKKNLHENEVTTNSDLPRDFSKWVDSSDGMWVAPEGSESELSYINLDEYPEANTGYAGHSVWAAVYAQNCIAKSTSDMCQEEKVFYRLISGLHTSISTHISYNYEKVGQEFTQNYELFDQKVANHPDRIENMYFTYLFLLRALNKIKSQIYQNTFATGNDYDDKQTQLLVRSLLDHDFVCFPKFDESTLFTSSLEKAELKKELRGHFQNISTIFNCISCETCKLYGKLQIQGVGAALKILFEENGDQIERNELIALINTLRQFSNSILWANEIATHKQLQYQHKQSTTTGLASFLSWLVSSIQYLLQKSVFIGGLAAVVLIVWKIYGRFTKNKKH